MFRIIKIVLVLAILAVLGLSDVSAKSLSGSIHQERATGNSARVNMDKTASGLEMMCLGLDIEEAKIMVSAGVQNPDSVEDAKESIDLLVFHLEGTAEGDKLNKLLADESATMKDFEAAVAEIEESLKERLTGEQSWAFNVGQALSDVYWDSVFGTVEEFRNSLKRLQSYIAEAPIYLSDEEANILKTIAQYADKNSLSDTDYSIIDDGLVSFIDLYFEYA